MINIEEYEEIVKNNKFDYVSLLDYDYPNYLQEITKPPFGLFYKGNIDNFNKTLINIIGNLNIKNKRYLNFLLHSNYCLNLCYELLSQNDLTFIKQNKIPCNIIGKSFIQMIENDLIIKIIKNKNVCIFSECGNKTNHEDSFYFNRLFFGTKIPILILNNQTLNNNMVDYINENGLSVYLLDNSVQSNQFDKQIIIKNSKHFKLVFINKN